MSSLSPSVLVREGDRTEKVTEQSTSRSNGTTSSALRGRAQRNVEELAKFYADTFEWNVSDTNNPFNTES